MPVLLCATTGAAASRLGPTATTVHSAFVIKNQAGFALPPLFDDQVSKQKLLQAKVFIIDECSMLTSATFNLILQRLQQILGATAGAAKAFLEERLIILVGDGGQLPPICRHLKRKGKKFCKTAEELAAQVPDCRPLLREEKL